MDTKNKTDRSTEQPTTKLYEAIRAGDQYAFSRYYEASLDRLVTLVIRITKDSEEAKNIAQDTFIKLWQMREQIDPAQSLDGFVSHRESHYLCGENRIYRHRDSARQENRH